jgi:Histidine kinase-, DNA gyrase B-, and HSP90-like ATPase
LSSPPGNAWRSSSTTPSTTSLSLRRLQETPTVAITLPGRGSSHLDAQVWVTDNGRGMDLGRLNNALRAGWSEHLRYGQLGLFGTGFNIATARLGNVTTVRTTRAGDPEWISVAD